MRYLAAVFLFYSVVTGACLLVFSLALGVSPILVVLMVAVLYGLGLAADLLPPGYPPVTPLSFPPLSKSDIEGQRMETFAQPRRREERLADVIPPEDAKMLAAQRRPATRQQDRKKHAPTAATSPPAAGAAPPVLRHRWRSAPAWVIASGMVIALFVAAWFISNLRDSGGAPASESAVAAFNAPSTRTASAANPPATSAASPAQPPASATTAPAETPTVMGTWILTDTVTSGPGLGQTFQLMVALTEADGTVTGTAEGMTLSGKRDGEKIDLNFARIGSRGTFSWALTPDGKLNGTFTDTASGSLSSGTSVGVRQRQ